MAEIRGTGGGDTPYDEDTLTRPVPGHALPGGPDGGALARPSDTGHRLPEVTGAAARQAGDLDDPDQARAAIERTRSRMSSTIDSIEEVLLRKKGQIQERLDVMAPVRQNALPIAGGVFAAGLLLGLLTGGDDHHELEYDGREEGLAPEAAAERRWRARYGSLQSRHRQLEQEVDEQRRELKRIRKELRSAQRTSRSASTSYRAAASYPDYGATSAYDHEGYGYEDDHDDGGMMESAGNAAGGIRDAVAGAVSGLMGRVFGSGGGDEPTGYEDSYYGTVDPYTGDDDTLRAHTRPLGGTGGAGAGGHENYPGGYDYGEQGRGFPPV